MPTYCFKRQCQITYLMVNFRGLLLTPSVCMNSPVVEERSLACGAQRTNAAIDSIIKTVKKLNILLF